MGEAAGKGKERRPQVRLGDVCDIYSGSVFPLEMQGKKEGKYPFYKVGDISKAVTSGYVYLLSCDNHIDDDDVKSLNAKILPKNTVVFAKIGAALKLNRRAIVSQPCLVDNNAIGIKAKTDIISDIYLYHFLKSVDLCRYSRETAIPSVKTSDIKQIPIPLPPLPEQRRIAAVLDQVSSLIALRKAQLAKLDLLVKARFVEMFGDPVKNEMGWEVVQLSKLTTKIGSGATPRGGEESYTSEGISLIRSMNVHNGNFKYEKLAHINNEQAKILENVTVEENDILINITGASVARSCIVPTQILPARVNQHVSIIRCNINRVLPHYLNQLLLNQNYQNLLLSIGGTGGATREAITKQQLEQLPIPLPPLDFQKKFSIFIDMIQMKRHLILSGLNKIDILYKSLSHEYYK